MDLAAHLGEAARLAARPVLARDDPAPLEVAEGGVEAVAVGGSVPRLLRARVVVHRLLEHVVDPVEELALGLLALLGGELERLLADLVLGGEARRHLARDEVADLGDQLVVRHGEPSGDG